MIEEASFAGSSNLASGTYDPETREMTVEFVDGGTYAYEGVPPQTWEGLKRAPSAGGFFARFVKNVFPYRQI